MFWMNAVGFYESAIMADRPTSNVDQTVAERKLHRPPLQTRLEHPARSQKSAINNASASSEEKRVKGMDS
jgi:hypothetical protein